MPNFSMGAMLHYKVDKIKRYSNVYRNSSFLLWQGKVETFLKSIPPDQIFDFVVTSPPYNIGKEYEKKQEISEYLAWQEQIINSIALHVPENGSICWQVGNYVNNGYIIPLDIELHPIFKKLGFKLRNRIVWRFGHGLHSKKRFSGRYETIMWYTKGDDYTFNLDAVRIKSKYPGKRHFKGPKQGEISSNPLGKNPEDIWDGTTYDVWDNIPNVKSNHVEKTSHPCQFPVGLIERLILALTNENDLVFDPFSGVGSSGVAAALHNRRFWGCEVMPGYVDIAKQRIAEALQGHIKYRPHDKPIYDHTKSKLSLMPGKLQIRKDVVNECY